LRRERRVDEVWTTHLKSLVILSGFIRLERANGASDEGGVGSRDSKEGSVDVLRERRKIRGDEVVDERSEGGHVDAGKENEGNQRKGKRDKI